MQGVDVSIYLSIYLYPPSKSFSSMWTNKLFDEHASSKIGPSIYHHMLNLLPQNKQK